MAEITIVNPHNEGRSEMEVTVNGEKWSIPRGETVDVPDYVVTEVRRSLAQRESLSLSDRDEREGEPESGGGGGSNVETATIEITVTDGTAAITSGEFPDWFTADNSQQIIGTVEIDGILAGEQPQDPTEEIECRAGITDIAMVPGLEEALISAAYSKLVGEKTYLGLVACFPSTVTQVVNMEVTGMSSPSGGTLISGNIILTLGYLQET